MFSTSTRALRTRTRASPTLRARSPLTRQSRVNHNILHFTFKPDVVQGARPLRISAVSLANNHVRLWLTRIYETRGRVEASELRCSVIRTTRQQYFDGAYRQRQDTVPGRVFLYDMTPHLSPRILVHPYCRRQPCLPTKIIKCQMRHSRRRT